MNDLSSEEIAWLAGIYEGEGSCSITNGRAIRIEITMTDKDIIDRICNLTGLGRVRILPSRNEKYKQAFNWGLGSLNAVSFLNVIMPWLGERRAARAKAAVKNWTTNKRQANKTDTECTKGHLYDISSNWRAKDGSCHLCHLDACRRFRAKKKAARSVLED